MVATVQSPATASRVVFPFTAIVGQEEMKLALLLNVIDPFIGGVMIMGDRGTGKSTTIRALADLLPEIDVVAGDPFNSHPSDPDLMSEELRQEFFDYSCGFPRLDEESANGRFTLGCDGGSGLWDDRY